MFLLVDGLLQGLHLIKQALDVGDDQLIVAFYSPSQISWGKVVRERVSHAKKMPQRQAITT